PPSLRAVVSPPAPAPPDIPPLSLHDALPILLAGVINDHAGEAVFVHKFWMLCGRGCHLILLCFATCDGCRILSRFHGHSWQLGRDRQSTRLNSSHVSISYAVFCLKDKTAEPT